MTLQRRGGAHLQQITFCTEDHSALHNLVAIAWPECCLLLLCLTRNRQWVSKKSRSTRRHHMIGKLLSALRGSHRAR